MKLALQISAGILIAAAILWMVSRVVGGAALQALADSVNAQIAAHPQPAATQTTSSAPYTQAQMDRWNAETDAEETRERRQEARCVVRTAAGRELHCDPRGPFTPR